MCECVYVQIECIDIAETERIRTQGRPVSEYVCVKEYACLEIDFLKSVV